MLYPIATARFIKTVMCLLIRDDPCHTSDTFAQLNIIINQKIDNW